MKSALKITLVYAAFASLWIILSDRIIAAWVDDIRTLTFLSSVKGLFYVTITSLMLFLMIRRELFRRNAIIADLNKMLIVKEDLIRELHHRVYNNIQVIIGVLSMETQDVNFSARTKERIVNRLLSMRSVYDVVYNYEDMKAISLGNVLSEYENVETRNIRIVEPAASTLLPVEILVSLLLVLDVILESIQDAGYCEQVDVAAASPGFLELRLGGCTDNLSTLLGENESFVRSYLASMKGDVEMIPGNPPAVRITYE